MPHTHASHPMRRSKQQLSIGECRAVLERGASGVLALKGGADDFPYAVPLSYVFVPADDAAEASGSLFFHCAKAGLKLDMLAQDDRVSFCVIDQDQVVPEKFTTLYRSVIAFGRLRVVEDRQRALAATRALGRKYNPGQEEALEQELSSGFSHMLVLELAVDALTGKQAKELVSS